MTCEELLAALGDYVDGELPDEVFDAFRSHLADCSPCEVVVDNVRHTITVYKSGQAVELPSELQEHLRLVLRNRWETCYPKH